MPYAVRYLPVRSGKNWAKIAKKTGRIVSRHRSAAKARASIRAYYASRHSQKVTRNPWEEQLISNTNRSRTLLRQDPTRTTGLCRVWEAEIRRRFRDFRRALWTAVVDLDVLGLGPRHSLVTMALQPRQYEFLTDPNKLSTFRDWVRSQLDASLLSIAPGTPASEPWTAKYLVSSYKQGLLDAYLATRRSLPPKDKKHLTEDSAKWLKESFVAPEATKRIQLLAMRAFERMRDITETASSKLGQVLAQGMLDGSSPRAIAKEMVAQIDVLEAKRALVIARTEIVYAHAEGQLDGYEELGVQELGLQAEWSTAGDDRVCEECHPMEGKVFSVDQARGMIPLHPNCRCTWLPFLLAPPKG